MFKHKILSLFMALFATTSLWAGNTITYIADQKLPEVTNTYTGGLHTDAFNVSITSHEFSNGAGTITFAGEITTIGDRAFYNCIGLTSVTIPNSVTTIGEKAFYQCTGLASVTIPSSVTTIGKYAFSWCVGLTSVTIPNSVTTIEAFVFEYCIGLTSVTIPTSITTIGMYAFSWCIGLTSVTIPNSVTTIGDRVFESCYALTSVTIPNSVTTIGYGAFSDINNIVYSGTATGSPWGAKCVNGYIEGYLVYSDATKTRLCGCFSSAIGDITIPSSVTTIGKYAFSWCNSLTSVTIPSSVTTIGKYAFRSCSGLTSINVAADNKYYVSIDGVLFNYKKDTLVQYPKGHANTTYTIPSFVTTIGSTAFYDCRDLTSVTIPTSVTTIEWQAFLGCTGLLSMMIPSSVTTIGDDAFLECTGLGTIYNDSNLPITKGSATYGFVAYYADKVYNGIPKGDFVIKQDTIVTAYIGSDSIITIPNGITQIGDSAFKGYSKLMAVTMPASIAEVGENAFKDCRYLYDVYCYVSLPPIAFTNSFEHYIAYLYVPCDNLRDYQLDAVFGSFKYIECLGAEEKPIDKDTVIITPSTDQVTLIWPQNDQAAGYSIEITKEGVVFCTLKFNAQGQLTGIAFAPSRNGAREMPAAEMTANGWQFTVTGLNQATRYAYTIDVLDAQQQSIKHYQGEFQTDGATGIEETLSSSTKEVSKFFRDGILYLLRDGKTYDAQGMLMK